MPSKFFKEFKSFASKGNAIDMAVGVITGAALTSVVNSLVKDVLMPPLGILLGDVDFSQFFIVLKGGAEGAHYHTIAAAQAAGATTLNIGLFINACVSFLITMFAIFLFVRAVNKLRTPAPVVVTTRDCPYCFTKIDMRATKCPDCCSAVKPVTPPKAPVEESKSAVSKLISKGVGEVGGVVSKTFKKRPAKKSGAKASKK